MFGKMNFSRKMLRLISDSKLQLLGNVRLFSNNQETQIQSFRTVISARREEASRTLLVQVNSETSCTDLEQFIEETYQQQIKNMFYYTTSQPNVQHFVLIEMENAAGVEKLLSTALHNDSSNILRIHSQFVWFKLDKTGRKKIIKDSKVQKNKINDGISKDILNAEDISHQMNILSEQSQVGELGTRLRFLTARQLEQSLKGIYPSIVACPFGSSVNGFGRSSSDLDLVLVHSDSDIQKNGRLVLQGKSASIDDRLVVQNHIEFIADVIHNFLPGCGHVKRITQARVPIVKFRQEFTNLDCDVSLYLTSCLHMSEMLYLISKFDRRARELSVAVRCWARSVGLTQNSPGRWISNFSLTLLVLFYLQQPESSVIPPLKKIPRTFYLMTDTEFQNYLNKLKINFQPSLISSQDLLLGFFQFYAAFDFTKYGINLLNGKVVTKPDYSAMFVVNPVEPELNVSKNVSVEETDRLKLEMRNAVWLLESDNGSVDSKSAWGLVHFLIQTEGTKPVGSYSRTRSRLLDVKALFDT